MFYQDTFRYNDPVYERELKRSFIIFFQLL